MGENGDLRFHELPPQVRMWLTEMVQLIATVNMLGAISSSAQKPEDVARMQDGLSLLQRYMAGGSLKTGPSA